MSNVAAQVKGDGGSETVDLRSHELSWPAVRRRHVTFVMIKGQHLHKFASSRGTLLR